MRARGKCCESAGQGLRKGHGRQFAAMTQAASTPHTLTITRPDDWHLHVRDGEYLPLLIAHAAAQFGRAIIMPNLRPPVVTARQAMQYKARILQALPAGSDFEPLMTLYLTDNDRDRKSVV